MSHFGASAVGQTPEPTSDRDAAPTVIVAHPGAELFGSDRMMLESVAGLVAAGARVVVVIPSNGPLVAELAACGAQVTIAPMLVLRKSLLRPRGWGLLLSGAVSGLAAAWRLIGDEKPTAVYTSTSIVPLWPLIARIRGVRSVSHIHEAEASSSRWVNRLLYLPHLAAHSIITNSEFSVETMRRSIARLADRTQVVYNGIASPSAPAPPRQGDGTARLLYIGRLSPRKGPHLVIETGRALAATGVPVRVTLLGAVFPGYEWYESELRTLAAESGIRVDFVGFQSDVWPYIADCDVVLVPSVTDESFGNTAVEAILGMRPVVTSAIPGLVEATAPYATSRAAAVADALALAAAVREVMTSSAARQAELISSRQLALERHAPSVYRSSIVAAVLGSRAITPTPSLRLTEEPSWS